LVQPWRRCVAWCAGDQKTIQACPDKEDRKVEPIPDFNKKRKPPETIHMACIRKGNSLKKLRVLRVNNRVWQRIFQGGRRAKAYEALGTKGPVFLVVDEWHRKNFEFHLKEKEGMYSLFREGLGMAESDRPLILVLVSATPVNPVREEYLDCRNSSPDDDGEITYRRHVRREVERWKSVIRYLGDKEEVGGHPFVELIHRKNSASKKAYEAAWEQALKGLRSARKKCLLVNGFHIRAWLEQYHQFASVAYGSNQDFPPYVVENLWFGGARCRHLRSMDNYGIGTRSAISRVEESLGKQAGNLKIQTLLRLLRRSPGRKYVIFCAYHATAIALGETLSQAFGENRAIVVRETLTNTIWRAFNDRHNRKDPLQYLIATDALAEGFSLHLADQDLVHFELAFSPLRMIQRFGRVWRIHEETGMLTNPRAYHIPHTYSSDEEILNRLERRWKILDEETGLKYPSYDIVLGERLSPVPIPI
jgi:hypothetical protein